MEFNFIHKYTSKALGDLFDSFVAIHYVESGSKGNTHLLRYLQTEYCNTSNYTVQSSHQRLLMPDTERTMPLPESS